MPKKSNPVAELKKERKALAAEYYDAIRANDHRKVDSLGKKIDAENRTGRGARVPISARSVNAAVAAVKGEKDLLRQSVMSQKHLVGGCWGMTRRRGRRTRSTRKNGFFGF
jgi:hypothetical protein